MKYTYLGRTGLQVSPFALGTMIYGSWGIDVEPSIQMIHHALDRGINFIDTADIYGEGTSEEIIGSALQGRRDKAIIATKCKIRTEEGLNGEGASRHRIMRQVEASLRRLRTDYIDLYLIHRPDPYTPIEETLRALDDLVRQGKVRYIGCSNFDAWRIIESLWVSDKRNLERFVTNQPSYSILDRYIESEILPVCQKYGLSTMAYSPLAGGLLTGKYRLHGGVPQHARASKWDWDMSSPENIEKLHKVEKLITLANEKGITLSQLALAWLLHRPSVLPIIGARHLEQLVDNLGALEVSLTEADMQHIDSISPSPFFDFAKA